MPAKNHRGGLFAGRAVRIRTTRLVSFTHRSIVAVAYEVEALEDGARIVLQSELVTNEEMPARGNDPRLAAILEAPLVSEEHQTYDGTTPRVVLVHRTRASGLRGIASAPTFPVDAPNRQLDHVLVRGPLAAVGPAEAVRLPLSDHRALVVAVEPA